VHDSRKLVKLKPTIVVSLAIVANASSKAAIGNFRRQGPEHAAAPVENLGPAAGVGTRGPAAHEGARAAVDARATVEALACAPRDSRSTVDSGEARRTSARVAVATVHTRSAVKARTGRAFV
jgi:hypothetical protein